MENNKGRIKPIPVAILLAILGAGAYWIFSPKDLSDPGITFDQYQFSGQVMSFTETVQEAELKFGEWQLKPDGGYFPFYSSYSMSASEATYPNLSNMTTEVKGLVSTIDSYVYEEGQLTQINRLGGDGQLLFVMKRYPFLEDDEYFKTSGHAWGAKLFKQVNYNPEGDAVQLQYYVIEGDVNTLAEVYDPIEHRLIERWEHEFDDDGRLSKVTATIIPERGSRTTLRFEYEYLDFDEKGNWILRALTTNNSEHPYWLESREITYR